MSELAAIPVTYDYRLVALFGSHRHFCLVRGPGDGRPHQRQPRFDSDGLAIARSVIVDKHGGTIHFETQEAKGTTFVVRLPYNASAQAPLPVPV